MGYKGKDGKSLSVDGIFGTNTDYAVRQYQKANGLAVDGIVGDATWTKMGFGYSSNESSKVVAPVKIDPNNWQDYDDNDDNYKKDKSLRGRDARNREQEQINSTFGKDRAAREGQSQDLHDSKKGKRNDDNSSYGNLKDGSFWDSAAGVEETLLGIGAIIIGGIIIILTGGAYVPAY